MQVVATAGHVDHGKSTLVEALTGSNPDRLAEERRRGMSIELGYCWTTLPGVGDVAFVDVPGHERFVPTMLAGVGPVPVTLFVVAADDPWMPQAAEHLAALDAIGTTHGVVAVTRADLADPQPMVERARSELSTTTLRDAQVVVVSGVTGEGLEELRGRLADVLRAVPAPDAASDVRLWVDRQFHRHGAGTVVTGTLPAGTVRAGDRLFSGDGVVRVRALQALGRPVDSVTGPARVALNIVGDAALERGTVLTTPDAFWSTDVVDVRVRAVLGERNRPPERSQLHVGAAAAAGRYRPLSDDVGRLSLQRRLPLRIGDAAILRDPGSRRMWGVTVLDPAPPSLRRRGAAAHRAAELADADGRADLAAELRRRGWAESALLRRIGVDDVPGNEEWLVDDSLAGELRRHLHEMVLAATAADPFAPGVPLESARSQLSVPSTDALRSLVAAPLVVVDGTVRLVEDSPLPAYVETGLAALRNDLADNPFAAPSAGRLQELGLDPRAVGAAARTGRLLHLGDGVVLLPGADEAAARRLSAVPQPFTTSQARVALGTSRRVALPLLHRLDQRGRTRRLPDDRRVVVEPT